MADQPRTTYNSGHTAPLRSAQLAPVGRQLRVLAERYAKF
jgi:hypothetical protein